ncbi:MAG TPA: hypothetical protein VH682_15390 [Gemmataceae bacterium]|jgi:hypothetical protein
MKLHARLRRLERVFLGDASDAELEAALEAELDKMEPGERERFLLEILREEELTRGRVGGRRPGKMP